MQQCILLSHVYIRDREQDKIDKVEFALKHWRKYNPDAYIVVTGHGVQPDIRKYCDHIIWPEQIIQKDINVGHPHLVSLGLEYIEQKGFEYVLKSRCDTVHNIKNIFVFVIFSNYNNKINLYHYFIIIFIIIDRSTVAGLLLQLVGHVLCISGVQVAWKTF